MINVESFASQFEISILSQDADLSSRVKLILEKNNFNCHLFTDLETFFAQAPQINPNVSKITGLICGYRVEEIEDKLIQQVRYLDKLIDELAKGKAMEKILRK